MIWTQKSWNPDRYFHTAPFCHLLIKKLLRCGKRGIWNERWTKEIHWTWVGEPHNRKFSEHCYLTVPVEKEIYISKLLISCQIYKQSRLNNHFGDPSAPGMSIIKEQWVQMAGSAFLGARNYNVPNKALLSSKCSVKGGLGFLTSSLSWAGLDKIIWSFLERPQIFLLSLS